MDLSDAQSIVIIGGGQAGAQAIQSLRMGGYEGGLTLIGGEPNLPYQRPPLSKAYMKGEFEEPRLYFKGADWYGDNRVDLVLGDWGIAIDRSARTVALESGGTVSYDALILATGSRPRPLPVQGADLGHVYDLRSLSDVERIRPNMTNGRRLVIIGAGYIGLEAAAVARQMGLEVTVLEMANRVLARVTSPLMSEFYETEHRAQGVDIRTGAQLSHFTGEGDDVSAAVLKDGTEIRCDLALIGIGIIPNDDIAQEAGLPCDSGIIVDRDARTCDPRIFAAGDCARRPLVHYGRCGRLESVHNAIEQGKLAAAAILGKTRPVEDCPWFWSDQYDLKLQIAGLSHGYDDIIVRGDPAARKFAAFYVKSGRLIAVDAINSAPEFLASKKLIIAGAPVAPVDLQDTSISMKEIAARVAA